MTPTFDERTSSSSAWETTFCSYLLDSDSGLYQVRYRYLHPALGRWLSRDPLKDVEMKLGLNIYAYIGNNPLVRSDSDGMGCKLGQVQSLSPTTVELYDASGDTILPTLPDALQDLLHELEKGIVEDAIKVVKEISEGVDKYSKAIHFIALADMSTLVSADFVATYKCCDCFGKWGEKKDITQDVQPRGDPMYPNGTGKGGDFFNLTDPNSLNDFVPSLIQAMIAAAKQIAKTCKPAPK